MGTRSACNPDPPCLILLTTMPLLILARRTARTVALLLVPALLLAQGLQLCLHVHDDAVYSADHAHASAVHLESTLSTAGEHNESATDVDVTLAALLKAFYAALAFVIVSVLVFHTRPQLGPIGRPWPSDFWPHPRDIYHLTPPLRAPPR
jgi:hypothetical protein